MLGYELLQHFVGLFVGEGGEFGGGFVVVVGSGVPVLGVEGGAEFLAVGGCCEGAGLGLGVEGWAQGASGTAWTGHCE